MGDRIKNINKLLFATYVSLAMGFSSGNSANVAQAAVTWELDPSAYAAKAFTYDDATGTGTGTVAVNMTEGGSSVVKYYTYNYTRPAGYTKIDTRTTLTDNISDKYFYGCTNNSAGAAIVNTSNTPHSISADFLLNKSKLSGGSIRNEGNISTITGDFLGNTAGNGGDGWGAGVSVKKGSVTSISGNFIGNTASKGGGAIDINGAVTRIEGNFYGNTSKGSNTYDGGGAIRVETVTGIINEIVGNFISNSTTSTAYGGAVTATRSGTIGTINGTFLNNKTAKMGGAIYNESTISSVQGTFNDNKAGVSGAAIYNTGTMTVKDSTFSNNTAVTSGGAIYNSGTLDINAVNSNVTFTNNKQGTTSSWTGGNYNDLYLEAGASLNANTNKSITFNGSVVSTAPATQLVLNNDDTIKGGTYVFNNNVTSGTLSAYNGAKVKLGSYTQANASVSHGKLNLGQYINHTNGSSIDAKNDYIDEQSLGSVTLASDLSIGIDVNLSAQTTDTLTATALAANGHNIVIDSIYIMTDGVNKKTTVTLTSDNKFKDVYSLSNTIADNVTAAGSVVNNYIISYSNFGKWADSSSSGLAADKGILVFVKDIADTLPLIIREPGDYKAYEIPVGGEVVDENLGNLVGIGLTVTGSSRPVNGGGYSGVTVGNSSAQALSISGVSEWKGFGSTAIINKANGTVDISNSTFKSNTTADIDNSGALNLSGTNSFEKIIDSDSTGVTTVTGGTTTVGNMTQNSVAISAGKLSVTNIAAAGGITNAGELELKGTSNANTITGTGTTTIAGNITNTGVIKTPVAINSGKTLTTAGSNTTNAGTATSGITNTVNNAGTLNLTGGYVLGAVTGAGGTTINGAVTNNSVIKNAITINSGKSLTTAGSNTTNAGTATSGITNTVNNAGTLTLTGGNILAAITGAGGTTINGAVTNNSVVKNAIIINSGKSLTTAGANATTAGSATLGITNTVDNSGTLTLTGGSVIAAITGAGGTTINGTVTNNSLIKNAITINSGKSLTTAGSNTTSAGTATSGITNTVNNAGTLTLTGGNVISAITGAGTTTINGAVTNNSVIKNAITINSGKSLTTAAANAATAGASTAGITNTVNNAGTLNLTGGSVIAAITGAGTTVIDGALTNSSVIKNAITINSGKSLTTAGANATTAGAATAGITNTVNNAGTLTLTGGNVLGAVTGAGETIINGAVTNNSVIKNAITINSGKSLTTAGSNTATAGAATSGITNTVNNAGTLNLNGGSIIAAVSGDNGVLNVTGNSTIAASVPVTQKELRVGVSKTLTNRGNTTVKTTLTNNGTISNLGNLYLHGANMTNAGSITGTGTVTVGNGTAATTLNNTGSMGSPIYIAANSILNSDAANLTGTSDITNGGRINLQGTDAVLARAIKGVTGTTNIKGSVTANGLIQNKLEIETTGHLKTTTDKLTGTNPIKNSGILEFKNTEDGSINSNITKNTTNGLVRINTDVDKKITLAKTIENNTIELMTGTLYVDQTHGGTLSGTTITGGDGIISCADGIINDFNLGVVDLSAADKNVNVAIDVDIFEDTPTSDCLFGTVVGNNSKIQLREIALVTSENKEIPSVVTIANGDIAAAIDDSLQNVRVSNNSGIGGLSLSYDNTTGQLTLIHRDIYSAIESNVTTKTFAAGIDTVVTQNLGALNGEKLTITGMHSFDGDGYEGISIANGQELSLNIVTSMDNFSGAAITAAEGSTLNITRINFGDGNDVAVANNGTMNLEETNEFNSDVTGASGATKVKNGKTTNNATFTQNSLEIGYVPTETDAEFENNGTVNVATININTAGSKYTNNDGNTTNVTDKVTNTGTVDNQGTFNGNVLNQTGAYLNNEGTLTGNVENTDFSTVDNFGTMTGNVKNSEYSTFSNLGALAGNVESSNESDFNNNGTITGNVENTNGSILNNNNIITGNIVSNQNSILNNSGTITGSVENGINSFVNNFGTIDGNADNLAGGSFDNTFGTITGNIFNAGESAPGAGDAGIFATLADNVGGNAVNDGILSVTGGTEANPSELTFSIENGASNTGETTVSGAINLANNRKIAQATLNIGDDTAPTDSVVNNNGKEVTGGGIVADNINILTADSKLNNTGNITINDAGAITSVGTITNEGVTATITGGTITSSNYINNTAGATIASAIINEAGGTVDNTALISGKITNKAGTAANPAGIVNTTASGFTGGIDNDGILNITGGTNTYPEDLGSNITNTSAGKGTVNIAGVVNTNGNDITQDVINVGKDKNGADVENSGLASTSAITADKINVSPNNSLTFGKDSTTTVSDSIVIASGGTLTYKDNAVVGGALTNGITITDGTLNLNAENDDVTLLNDITGAGNGIRLNVQGGNTVNVRSSITNVINDVLVEDGATLALDDNGNITQGGAGSEGTAISLGTGSALTVNSNAGRVLDNKIKALPGTDASLNLNSDGSTGAITLSNVIEGADNVNINSGTVNIGTNGDGRAETWDTLRNAQLNIGNGATANIDTSSEQYNVNNNINGNGNNSTVKLTGLAGTPGTSNSGTQFTINAPVTNALLQVAQGELYLPNENYLNNTGIGVDNGATLNTMTGTIDNYNANTTFANGSQIKIDANVLTGEADRFVNSNQGANDSVTITDMNIHGLENIVRSNTTINLSEATNIRNLKVGDSLINKEYVAMTPIRRMAVNFGADGTIQVKPSSGSNEWRDYHSAVLAGPVAAQVGSLLAQINSYDEAFRNMDMYMLMPRKQRIAMKFRNKTASAESTDLAFDPTMTATEREGLWFRPFATYEKVNLRHGPNVENFAYGTYFGGESELTDLGHGWDGMWGAYVGYNGSMQDYHGVDTMQNGGTLGLIGMLYRGNYFIGSTINIGASVGDTSNMFGHEDFTSLTAGIAAKTGYNWELFDGAFIIQPSMVMSYSFVNTFDYTNSAGVRISSDPLNAIQMEPGLKFIGNLKNGWQPYTGISIVFNLMDKGEFMANDIALPSMSIKPFIKYGFGVRKTWGDRFTGFLQTFATSGGRNGVGIQAGFRWSIGKGNSAKGAEVTAGSVPELKPATVELKNNRRKSEVNKGKTAETKPAKVEKQKPAKVETKKQEVKNKTEKAEKSTKKTTKKTAKKKAVKVELKNSKPKNTISAGKVPELKPAKVELNSDRHY